MQRLTLLIFVAFFFLAGTAYARDVKLIWEVSAEADGYHLYMSAESGNYPVNFEADILGGSITESPLITIPEDGIGKHYFILKAYNEAGESDPSNEVFEEQAVPLPPGNVKCLSF